MNTRLQVEHPVTELVTGIDLVHAQLHVAQGGALGPEFDALEPHGHAIEVRLYAEDPARGFAPSPGRIDILRWPQGPGIRTDAGVYEGAEIPIYYDPMIAKLIAFGADRAEAIRRLQRALGELRIEGIASSTPLFQRILADEDFRAGHMDIKMLERKIEDGTWATAAASAEDADDRDLPLVAAAIAHFERQQKATSIAGVDAAPGAGSSGRRRQWRLAARREATGGSSWN
jgi:acetyl/propionyl-CoA carboxylase alpha subunit